MMRESIKSIRAFLSFILIWTILNGLLISAQNDFGPFQDLQYPNSKLQAALLVQRDISLDIPISHVLLPGINLTSSWFWTRQYTIDNITGISDLFDMGYRRFDLDLWWNNVTTSFQLCPEQIISNSTSNDTSVVTTTITQITTTVVSSTTSFSTIITSTITASSSSTSAPPDPSIPISLANGYSCAPGADLKTVLNTIQSILSRTDNQLRQAGLIVLILNLHTLPSLASNATIDLSLPDGQSLSQQINATLEDWIYTPRTLSTERKNINTTFLADSANPIIDISSYYDVIINDSSKIASTPNGWPSTRHLFEIQGRRLLIGFGSIDISTMEYDTDQDTSIIFPSATFGGQDQLISSASIINSPNSCLGPQGPIFGPNGEEDFNSTIGIQGNMTFAISEDPTPSNPLPYDSLQGIITCGLSPIIGSPLQNTNSGNLSPILPIAATIWSWLPPNEPQNTSVLSNGTQEILACAALDADSGHWIVLECNTQLNLACRVNSSLYTWQIGDTSTYFQAMGTCPAESTFDVPRTPLENQFLLAVLRESNVKSLWIDLNSLKAPDCWTVGDTDCPYGNSTGVRQHKVLVPIVASIIVIVVFLLMCLVKWQSHWLVGAARKRRRVMKGFLEYADYEGIPA